MFLKFDAHFTRDPFSADAFELSPGTMGKIYPPLRSFFARCGGQSFNDGLYRVIGPSTLDDAADFVSVAFPRVRERAKCFAYDWMGRIFALDAARSRDGEPQMLMFEPDNALAFEVPRDLATFHNVELTTRSKKILESELHAEWLGKGGAVPRPNQCVGYKLPLFFSGPDTIDYMSMYRIDIHWHILDQLIERTAHLPPGTRINKLTISD
jgi:hypothetical protein